MHQDQLGDVVYPPNPVSAQGIAGGGDGGGAVMREAREVGEGKGAGEGDREENGEGEGE